MDPARETDVYVKQVQGDEFKQDDSLIIERAADVDHRTPPLGGDIYFLSSSVIESISCHMSNNSSITIDSEYIKQRHKNAINCFSPYI